MKENELTPEKSLEIIRSALRQNQKEFEKDGGTPMIIWGSLVTLFSVAIWFLWDHTSNPVWNLLWFSLPIAGYFWTWKHRKGNRPKASNILNRAVGSIWIIFGIISVGISVIYTLAGIHIDITQSIILLMGLCTGITGLICQNWPITIAGIISALTGPVICHFVNGAEMSLVLGGAALISLILPGIIMNITTSKNR